MIQLSKYCVLVYKFLDGPGVQTENSYDIDKCTLTHLKYVLHRKRTEFILQRIKAFTTFSFEEFVILNFIPFHTIINEKLCVPLIL